MSHAPGRPNAEQLLRDLGAVPKLTVYLGYAPGTGKTHRLLSEAASLAEAGERVALGWIETKGRPDLAALIAGLPRIPPRRVRIGDSTFEDFDIDAALASDATVIVLDELAHTNLEGARNVKRWEDALALRAAGRAVIGAFNVQHLENIAPAAEAMIGFPVREIVPMSFVRSADQVVAIDASPDVVEARLHDGAIVQPGDVGRALQGPFRPQTLRALRAMLLQTVDELASARGETTQMAVALVLACTGSDVTAVVRRASTIAQALNLSLEMAPLDCAQVEPEAARAAREAGARLTSVESGDDGRSIKLEDLHASLVAVPSGELAKRLASGAISRDLLIIDSAWAAAHASKSRAPGFERAFGQTLADRQRIGYGKLTVYLGAAAGCGKTYAMLDRGHQLLDDGVDVVAALVETHGRKETARLLEGLPVIPRLRVASGGIEQEELDLDGVLRRKPAVALIDELAHTNAAGSAHAKRWLDVLTVIRAGISVITTLNVQHLEGLNDLVRRLTGVTVRETIADPVLEFADEVVLIDASPQTLRDRLRAGKIYPPERVEAALSSFFQTDNLLALRELAVREALRSRKAPVAASSTGDLMLGVRARERDVELVRRAARLAARLSVDLHVIHVHHPRFPREPELVPLEAAAKQAGAKWSVIVAEKPARELARRALLADALLIVEGAREKAAFLQPTFARRALDADAPQLLVFSPAM